MAIDLQDTPQHGRLVAGEHRLPVRVYYEDTDAGGIVYHASYLRFMERARSDMLRVAGIDQRGALAAGEGIYAVTALAIRYRRPAKLDDALLVVSRVTQIGAALITVHQRVIRGDEVLAEADVTVAFVAPNGRPRRQPAAWMRIFEGLKGDDAS